MIQPLLIGTGIGASLVVAGLNYAALAPRCQWFGPVVCSGDRRGPRRIALTFDDGPSPNHTENVLRILEQYRVPACFFCIGRHCQAHPALLQQTHSAGHLLANHSYDHINLGAFRGRSYWIDQLSRTNDAIHHAIQRTPRLFRPPMGIKTPRILYAPKQLGMTTVNWSHRGFDTMSLPPDHIAARITRKLNPGSVLMLHDGVDPSRPTRFPNAYKALPQIIETILEQGFVIDRLDRVLGLPGYLESEEPECGASEIPTPA